MLVTVEFDNETAVIGDEVADVPTYRLLPPPSSREVEPEVLPEDYLGVGQVRPELLGSPRGKGMAWDSGHDLNLSESTLRFKGVDRGWLDRGSPRDRAGGLTPSVSGCAAATSP